MTVDDSMTDKRWNETAPAIGDGWIPGRVNCDGSDGPAFGWSKGSFGVFEGNGETEIGLLELSSLTHLKTGKRIGLFSDPESAAIAGDLAERVGDWSEIDGDGTPPQWQGRAKQMYALWQSAGLLYGPISSGGKGVWCAVEPIVKHQ